MYILPVYCVFRLLLKFNWPVKQIYKSFKHTLIRNNSSDWFLSKDITVQIYSYLRFVIPTYHHFHWFLGEWFVVLSFSTITAAPESMKFFSCSSQWSSGWQTLNDFLHLSFLFRPRSKYFVQAHYHICRSVAQTVVLKKNRN